MPAVRAVAAALAVLLAVLPSPGAAAPYEVRLGIERIVLDAPPGFQDTTAVSSPRLQELADTLTPAANRVLMFALTDPDYRRFMSGDPIEARRYMLVVTPKGLERERVSGAQFATFVADSLRALGPVTNPPDLRKYLEKQPEGRAVLLAELRKEPGIVSVMQGSRLPPLEQSTFFEPPPRYLLATTTLLLLHGKALQLSVYTGYDTPEDLEWLRFITERWLDDLLRLNRGR